MIPKSGYGFPAFAKPAPTDALRAPVDSNPPKLTTRA
jgi:hypothetical protein